MDGNPCTQASPCATVSHAVAIAASGDTIELGPGSFTDHVTVSQAVSPLTIQGAGMTQTTVTGGFVNPGSVFTIPSGATATIEDLAITGGQADNGGGVNSSGTLTMSRDEVAFNAATGTAGGGSGGGVVDDGGHGLIEDSAIFANQAAAAGGGVYAINDTLQRDLIFENQVVGASGTAGGST